MKTITANKSQNKEYLLPCGLCHVKTRHVVIQSVDVNGEWCGKDTWYVDHYQIVQCKGCEILSFRKSHMNSEDWDYDDEAEEGRPVEYVELYPSRVAGRQKLRQVSYLPLEVSKIYNETHAAICNRLPVLAAIGIRALVEAICKEKAASGKNLEEKIGSLVIMGILTKEGAEILHSMRILGNVAAHEALSHSNDMLSTAMDIVEHLLTGVYILPKSAEKLPKRKACI